MKTPDDLLTQILAGEDVSSFREASLQKTLAAVRAQRRRRQALVAGGVVAMILAAARMFKGSEQSTRQEVASSPLSIPAATAPGTPNVKFISDEELFALFPGRAMALVGEPGQQQLLFLDGENARAVQ